MKCNHAGVNSISMKRLLEFGRKALFYVRVLSGYEERRIRSFRLQLEKRIQQVQLTSFCQFRLLHSLYFVITKMS